MPSCTPDEFWIVMIVHFACDHVAVMSNKTFLKLIKNIWRQDRIIVQQQHIFAAVCKRSVDALIVTRCNSQILLILNNNDPHIWSLSADF